MVGYVTREAVVLHLWLNHDFVSFEAEILNRKK